MKNSQNLAEVCLTLVAIGWGLGFPLMKGAMHAHSALTVMCLRFLLATLFFLPFTWSRFKKLTTKTVLAGFALGTALFLAFLFYMQGLASTTASNTGFLAGLAIIWVPAFERLLLGKSPTVAAHIAILCGITGMIVMSGLDQLTLNKGDMLIIIGSLFTALHVLGVDRWSAQHDALSLSFIQITTIATLALLALMVQGAELIPATVDTTLIVALLVTAAFCTTLAFWVQTTFQRYTTPTRAMLIYNLEPLFSALFAVFLLQEQLSVRVVVGGMIIFIGMTLPGLYNLVERKRTFLPRGAN